jgi:hypothetical protein
MAYVGLQKPTVQQLLKFGEQVVQVLECVVAVTDYQAMQVLMLKKQLQ